MSVIGSSVGEVLFYGRGAGSLPTASAVVADVIDALQNRRPPLCRRQAPEGFLFSAAECAGIPAVELPNGSRYRVFV